MHKIVNCGFCKFNILCCCIILLFFSNKHGFIVQRKVEMRITIASIRFIMTLTVFRFIFFGTFEFASFIVRRLLPFDNFILMRGIIDQFYVGNFNFSPFNESPTF